MTFSRTIFLKNLLVRLVVTNLDWNPRNRNPHVHWLFTIPSIFLPFQSVPVSHCSNSYFPIKSGNFWIPTLKQCFAASLLQRFQTHLYHQISYKIPCKYTFHHFKPFRRLFTEDSVLENPSFSFLSSSCTIHSNMQHVSYSLLILRRHFSWTTIKCSYIKLSRNLTVSNLLKPVQTWFKTQNFIVRNPVLQYFPSTHSTSFNHPTALFNDCIYPLDFPGPLKPLPYIPANKTKYELYTFLRYRSSASSVPLFTNIPIIWKFHINTLIIVPLQYFMYTITVEQFIQLQWYYTCREFHTQSGYRKHFLNQPNQCVASSCTSPLELTKV